MIIVQLSPPVGTLNFLLYVSFKFLFSITAQFTLPLDLFKELQKLRAYRVMTTQECHRIGELARSTCILFRERLQQKSYLPSIYCRSFAPIQNRPSRLEPEMACAAHPRLRLRRDPVLRKMDSTERTRLFFLELTP